MSIPELTDVPELIPIDFNTVISFVAVTTNSNPTKRQILGLSENATFTEDELENARTWMLEGANDEQKKEIEDAYLFLRKEICKLT